MKLAIRTIMATLPLFLFGCTHHESLQFPSTINQSITSLTGWLETTGEWALFPHKNSEKYDPYTPVESAKCISLINGTGEARAHWNGMNHKWVKVSGTVVRYDELANSPTNADRLLAKKYYKDQAVENFCLRDYVFIVEGISKLGKK